METENLKQQLRELMTRKDLTLADIGKKIGRSVKTVWNFLHENNGHNFQTVERIRDLIERDQQKREAKERRTE